MTKSIGGWPRAVERALALVALATATGCGIPTKPPIVESTWVVGTDALRVGVEQFLPSGTTVVNNTFASTAPAVTTTSSLGALCSACAPLAGQTVPKPAFTGTITSTVTMPSGVQRLTLGPQVQLRVRLRNNLNFDPIRPSAGARGRITIGVVSSGQTIASLVVEGLTTGLFPGTSSDFLLPLPVGSVISGATTVSAAIESPAGDPVVMDPARTVVATVTPENIRASSAEVVVTQQAITAPTTELSLEGVSADVRDRITGSTIELAVQNPFGAAGPLQVAFRQGNTTIVGPKDVTLRAVAVDTLRVSLTGTETRALLGVSGLAVRVNGTVSGAGAGNVVTVTPTQAVEVVPSIRLRTEIGG